MIQSLFFNISVHYDEHRISSLAKRLLEFFKKLNLCNIFSPAGLLMNTKEAYGYTLTKKMREDLDSCLEEFCTYYIPDDSRRVKHMTRAYLAPFLSQRLTFITMVKAKIEIQKCPEDCRHIVYLVRHPFNLIVKKFHKEEDLIIKELGFMENIRFFLKPFLYMSAILLSKFIPQKRYTNIKEIRPAVWVEYCHNDSIDFTFWQNYVNPDNFDIVRYLDRPDDGPLSEAINKIEKKGFKWVNLHFFPLLKLSNLCLSNLKRLFGYLFVSKTHLPWWLKVFQFEYNLWFMLYEAIFKKFKTKILIQYEESFWKQEAQAKAIESAGGIMIGYNWSNYYFSPLPTHFFPQHVYFVWGRAIQDYISKIGISSKYILPSGVWAMPDRQKPPELNDLAKRLNFVIAIFDGTAAYNNQNSPDTFTQFYLTVLDLLENNPQWGGIIKGKNYDLPMFKLLPRGDEIVSRITALNRQKRVVVLDRNYNPLAASAYADLCVCHGLNSAGIISAIHGFPAIHWDCAGIVHEAFYKEPDQQIVYLILDEFKEAIVKASAGDKAIGDFAKWRQEFNYFNDFLASRRVGNFIQSFMDKVLNANDVKHSLDYSVNKYIKENNIKIDMREEILCI